MCQRLGTPNTPANPFHAGGEFRGFHGSLICYGLPRCSAPCTDLIGFPAIGAFYFHASNKIGPFVDITTASAGLLVWGDFCQGGAPKGPIHFLVPQFLCSTWQPFLRPDPHLE